MAAHYLYRCRHGLPHGLCFCPKKSGVVLTTPCPETPEHDLAVKPIEKANSQ